MYQKRGCRVDGFTLIEVVVTVAISTLLLSTLGGVLVYFVQMKATIQREQETFYALAHIKQFIQDECNLAETVCIEVVEGDTVDIYQPAIDISHASHQVQPYTMPKHTAMPIKQVVLNRYRRSRNDLDISKVITRTEGKVGEVFDLFYQGNLLGEKLSVWSVYLDDTGYWMTLGIDDASTTFYIPMPTKEERSEPWGYNTMY